MPGGSAKKRKRKHVAASRGEGKTGELDEEEDQDGKGKGKGKANEEEDEEEDGEEDEEEEESDPEAALRASLARSRRGPPLPAKGPRMTASAGSHKPSRTPTPMDSEEELANGDGGSLDEDEGSESGGAGADENRRAEEEKRCLETERLEKDGLEQEQGEQEAEKQRAEKEQERLARLEQEQREKERLEKQQREQEEREKERLEQEQREKEQREKREQEEREQERREKEQREKADEERREKEEREQREEEERREKEQQEKERLRQEERRPADEQEQRRIEDKRPEGEPLEDVHPEQHHGEQHQPEQEHVEQDDLEEQTGGEKQLGSDDMHESQKFSDDIIEQLLPGLGRKELSDAERELLGLPPAEESWERLKGESKPKLEALLFCAEELSAVESSAAFTERTNLEAQVQALRGDRAALRGMLGCLLSNVPDLDLETDWASEPCPRGEEGDMEDKDMDAAADNEEGRQPRAQDGGGVAEGKEQGTDVEMEDEKAPPRNPTAPTPSATSLERTPAQLSADASAPAAQRKEQHAPDEQGGRAADESNREQLKEDSAMEKVAALEGERTSLLQWFAWLGVDVSGLHDGAAWRRMAAPGTVQVSPPDPLVKLMENERGEEAVREWMGEAGDGKEEQRTHDGQSSKGDGEDAEMADQPADKRDEEIRNLKKELARLNLKAYGLGRPGDRDVQRQWAFEAAGRPADFRQKVWSNPEQFTDELKKENSLPTGVELRVGQGLEGPSLKMPLKFERKMEYVSGVHAIADLGFSPITESVGAMKVTRSEKDKIECIVQVFSKVKMWAAPSNNITPGKMCGHYATFQEGFLNGKATLVPTAKDGANVSEAKGSFAKGRTDAFPSTRKEQLKFLAGVEGEVGGRLPKRKMKGDKEVVVGVDVKGKGKGEWAYGGGEVKTTFTASTSKISYPQFAASASISPQPVPGISSFYGYEGDRPGFWAGHVEDCRLPSTNTQQRGRKLWYVLPPGYEEKMWKLLKVALDAGLPLHILLAEPQETVIVHPLAIHWGVNVGENEAVAINLEPGVSGCGKGCECKPEGISEGRLFL
ncbi:hypothetical protein JCM10213v2_007429 [Rhodosporidiobolus nylandii]